MSERQIEVPWAVKHAVSPILDVGCVGSGYLTDLSSPVDGIDLRTRSARGLRQQFHGDVRTFEFPQQYRTVLAVSTLEHVGLYAPAYGTHADDPNNGDRESVLACVRACEPGGRVLISVPFGAPKDYGWFRQYDRNRLEGLLEGLTYSYEVWTRYQGDTTGEEVWAPAMSEWPMAMAETLEYDIDGYSARGVALVTVEV